MNNNDIFNLVKALSGGEKRYIKTLGRGDRKFRNFYKLFEAIEKQDDYNEEKLRKKFSNKKFIRQFAFTKNYMYNFIFRGLRSYHSGDTFFSRFKSSIQDIEILYEKGLYSHGYELIQKLKPIAFRQQRFISCIELIYWEARYLTVIADSSLVENFKAEDMFVFLEKLKRLWEYNMLSHKMFLLTAREQTIRSKESEDKFLSILNNKLLQDESHADSFPTKLVLYTLYNSYYLYIKEDKTMVYYYCKKLVDSITSQPEQIDEMKTLYLAGLNNLLNAQLDLKKYEEFSYTLALFKSSSKKFYRSASPHFMARTFERTALLELTFFINTLQIENGIIKIPEIENGLSIYNQWMNDRLRILIFFAIAHIYIIDSQFSQSLRWLNKIVNSTDETIREDYQGYSRILLLLVHYELNNFELLEHLVKSVYRFLYKKRRLYGFDNLIIQFIRRRFSVIMPDNTQALIKAFSELRDHLLRLTEDVYEKKTLDFFDFASWLESKITGKSLLEVLQEKSKKEIPDNN